VTPLLPAGDLVLVAHGHPLRALTVRWLRLHPDGGRPFRPATGTLSTRGVERSQPVILSP
jgi:probable phosphoglycerate mutase